MTSRRYMFIGGTNFGYWNGEYSSTGMRYYYSGKSVHCLSYFLGYLRCQRTLQPTAHQLRLWRPAHRSRRPHRQILCHPKCYQNGKISLAEERLQYCYLYALIVELEMQFSFPVELFPKSTVRSQKARSHPQRQSMRMGVWQWRRFVLVL